MAGILLASKPLALSISAILLVESSAKAEKSILLRSYDPEDFAF